MGLLFALLVSLVFHPWLKPYQQPQRGGPELPFRAGDLTPLFSVWTQVTARSLFERGELPLWSDHVYCGEPFFSKPQIGVISLTTLLCAVLPPHVAATWTFLLHLWIAGMTTYVWCLDVLTRAGAASHARQPIACDSAPVPLLCLAAASGGICFMMSGLMVEHAMVGHGPIVLVACWTPLVLLCISRALSGDRPVRSATLAGVVVAVQLLAGGETMFLYNAIAGTLWATAWVLTGTTVDSTLRVMRGDSSRVSRSETSAVRYRLLRAILVGACIGLFGFGLSALKVLPGLNLIPVSNRAGGLPAEEAGGIILEFREPAVLRAATEGIGELTDLRTLLPLSLTLAIVGLTGAIRTPLQRTAALAAILLIVAGVAIAQSQTVFRMLWHVLPMFRYQRIPQRALVLPYLGVSVLVSLGVYRLLAMCFVRDASAGKAAPDPPRPSKRSFAGALVGTAIALGIALESWAALSELPPTADIRVEIRENQLLNYLARQPDRFRIHCFESRDRNWGIEHVTVPLGLSNLAGWDHLWLLEYHPSEGIAARGVRDFLTASYQAAHAARFWGIMSVKYVTAMQPLEMPGLRFVAKFDVAPSSQPAKSAGPYLYENDQWMPRAWVASHAILVIGDRAERLEAAYHLMDHAEFRSCRMAVIQSDRAMTSFSQGELGNFLAAAVPNRLLDDELDRRLTQIGLGVLPYTTLDTARGRAFFWNRFDQVAELFTASANGQPERPVPERLTDAIPELQIEAYRDGFVRLRPGGRRGTLLLAEKFAHFPGWHVSTSAGSRELHKANGVASAILLDGSEEWIDLTYWPAGLSSGLLITAISLITAPIVSWFGDRVIARAVNRP